MGINQSTAANNSNTYFPAEWEKHAGCIMAWCSAWNTYYPGEVEKMRTEQVAIAKAISRFEPVTMLINAEEEAEAKQRFGAGIHLPVMKHHDVWTRDTLSTFVRKGADLHGVGWNFNVWGNKFPHYDRD